MGSKNEYKYDPPEPAHVQSLCKGQQSPQLFEQGDGAQPAGPRSPWQAEVIRPCKRAFTHYSTFHQNSFQTKGTHRNATCRAAAMQHTWAEAKVQPIHQQDTTDSFWGIKPNHTH